MTDSATASRIEERLLASAKLLRSFSQGVVGDARHWAKDCATYCDNGAAELTHLRGEVERLTQENKTLWKAGYELAEKRDELIVQLRALSRLHSVGSGFGPSSTPSRTD